MSRITRVLAVSVFLIGFPLVSWYYLNQGYNYRVKILSELKENLGEIPAFQLQNQNAKMIDKQALSQKVVISNFVDLNALTKSQDYLDKIYKIQDQFGKKDDIVFCTFIQTDSLAQLQKYYEKLVINEPEHWHFLTGNQQEMTALLQNFPFPEGATKNYAGNPVVAIADTSSIIRHFYDMNNIKEVSRLVEHIANLMPKAPPEEARMKRELEK
jgi:cytochrome oxidase Cu insertion factor (SCO1/SenC/PrrC family)